MLNAYKLSAIYRQLVLDGLNQMVAKSPAKSTPSWYTFCNANDQWSLCEGSIYSGFWTSYNALEQFNYLLKGDLDPARNDNNPVFIDAAA